MGSHSSYCPSCGETQPASDFASALKAANAHNTVCKGARSAKYEVKEDNEE